MKNDTFIKVGTVVGNHMLVQISSGKGMLIHLPTGNRVADGTINLYQENDGLRYGCYYGDLVKLIPEYPIGTELNVIAITNAGTIPQQPEIKKKPDVVNIVRYIRPLNDAGQIDNLYGVTLLIALDYKNREIEFKYSICRGDNFDKKMGIAIAKERRESYVIAMPDGGISESGVVDEIVNAINFNEFNMNESDVNYIVGMYTCSAPLDCTSMK